MKRIAPRGRMMAVAGESLKDMREVAGMTVIEISDALNLRDKSIWEAVEDGREAAESRNQAESLVHSTEQQLKEHGDKVDDQLKGEIETAIAETRTAVEGGDPEAMKAKTEALAQAAMKLGQAIYEKTQAAGGADAGAQSAEATAEGGPTEDEVVDAEFSEVDEDKKA